MEPVAPSRRRLPWALELGITRVRAARELLPRLARLLTFLLCVNLVLGALWAHAARARLGETLLSIGDGLMAYADAHHQEPARTLMLNGLPLQLSTGVTERPVADVLDHFHAMCLRRGGKLAEQRRELELMVDRRPTLEERPAGDLPDGWLDGVLRFDTEERGIVACLDLGEERVGPQVLAARLRAFVETGDVSQVGDLRYVSAERGEHDTVFVAMWTEGELDLGRMFPADGDAPGVDPPHVPRPGSDRRLLSAWEQGQAPALNQYDAPGRDAGALDAFYRRQLPAAGWVIHEPPRAQQSGQPSAGHRPSPSVGFIAERDGQMAAFSFVDRAGGAIATVSTLRRPVGP